MDSQYNRDSAFIHKNFTTGSDTFIVLTDTPMNGCIDYSVLSAMDRLQWRLRQLPVVESTNSAASFANGHIHVVDRRIAKMVRP